MIWLTWRQFRVPATMMAAALAVLAAILAVTGPGLADEYSTGIAACTAQGGNCTEFVDRFFQDKQDSFLAVTAVMLVLPALIGLFWGAPLIAGELEGGTHRLVWNQSITRTRWLTVKLGLIGLAAVVAAGVGTLAVSWWAEPIDKSAAGDFARMAPLLFDTRGIVPIAYAVFAFALGVTVGMLVRRTLPAMATTLAVFLVIQIAMSLVVRAHLLPPTRSTVVITESNLMGLQAGPSGPLRVEARATDPGAWLLSSHTVDASGRRVEFVPLTPASGPCAPAQDGLPGCLAEIKRLGYRQRVVYQPASRFWPLQWVESGLYLAFALALAGFCFWRLRKRVA